MLFSVTACLARSPVSRTIGSACAEPARSVQEQQAASVPQQSAPQPSPTAAVPISQQSGYRVGYRIGQQNAPTLAAENSASGSPSAFSSVTLYDVTQWCDTNADPEYTYAPEGGNAGVNSGGYVNNPNPNDHPAIVGSIAGMKSKGAG
jgi:hypothetical protein